MFFIDDTLHCFSLTTHGSFESAKQLGWGLALLPNVRRDLLPPMPMHGTQPPTLQLSLQWSLSSKQTPLHPDCPLMVRTVKSRTSRVMTRRVITRPTHNKTGNMYGATHAKEFLPQFIGPESRKLKTLLQLRPSDPNFYGEDHAPGQRLRGRALARQRLQTEP